MTGAEVQLWQLSSSSSLAITAQLHQQRSNSSSDSLAAMQPYSRAAMQPCSRAALSAVQPCSTNLQPGSPKQQPCSFTALRSCGPNEKPQDLRYHH